MKKFLTLILIFIFCLNSLSVWAYSLDEYRNTKWLYIKNVIIYKWNLNKTNKWKKIIKTVDSFVLKQQNNKTALEKINNKIITILNSNSIKDVKNQETINTIKYIEAKINIALITIYENEKNDIFTDQISVNDKEFIEAKIIKLQLNTLEKSFNLFEDLIKEFEEVYNYQETWNFELDLNMEHEDLWKFNWNFKLNDYTSNVSNFDYQLKWKIETLINALPKWEDEIKFQLSSFIDFISKDWNIYLLLKELNITNDKNNTEIENIIKKVQNIAKENKYIKYSDNEAQVWLNIIRSLNPKLLYNDLKNTLAKPIITAYKKEWNRYYLKPTKYGCDKIKELSNKFDPFSPKTCTEKQYNDLLKELNNAWKFYAEFINNTDVKISFEWSSFEWIKNLWHIVFNNTKILEAKYDIMWWDNWLFNFYYKDKSSLNLQITDFEDDFNFDFKSTLDTNNKFTKIDFNTNINGYNSKTVMKLKLENKNITWDFYFQDSLYNWDTDKNEISTIINGKISWKTNVYNSLSELNIDYTWINKLDEFFNLNWKFVYKDKKISFSNKVNNQYLQNEFVINWEFDNENILNNWNFKLKILEKSWTFDYEKYEYIYSDEYKDIIDINIDIKNKKISGYSKFFESWKDFLNINHTWEYAKNKFELNNNFSFSDIFTWNSMDTRNSKRISDLAYIQSKISLKQVEWVPLEYFIIQNNKYAWKEVYVWWNKLIIWEDYFVWTPNYEVLNINKNTILDPLDNSEYIIWATKNGWYVFQIFTKIENLTWQEATIFWTYQKRFKNRLITINEKVSDYVLIIADEDANSLKVWDITNLWKIVRVSRDWVNITLDKKINNIEKSISLIIDDSDSLIYLDWKAILNNTILNNTISNNIEDNKISWDLNIKIDQNDNNNIFILILKAFSWNKEIINWTIKNIWTKESKKVDIKAPTNIIDYKDLNYNNY